MSVIIPVIILVIVWLLGLINLVIMSFDDYNSSDETAYLFRNSVNAERLWESIKQAKAGSVAQHELIIRSSKHKEAK
jgi:PHD/YefM family antitoxin component YafN of YafNO toxin-antitoxin module